MRLAGDDERLPPMAREALGYIVAQIHDIESRLKIFEQRILSPAKEDQVCRRLMTVQSSGPYIATAIAATIGEPLSHQPLLLVSTYPLAGFWSNKSIT